MATRLVMLAAVVGFAAPLPAQRQRTVMVAPGQMAQIISDTMGAGYDLPYSYGRVYHALVEVFADLKIVTTEQDSLTGQVGNLQFITTSPLGRESMSSYLSCGSGMTGQYADTDRIYLSIMSYLTPSGPNQTTLHTGLLATAVNVAGGSRQPMPCGSRGRLELQIFQRLIKRIASP